MTTYFESILFAYIGTRSQTNWLLLIANIRYCYLVNEFTRQFSSHNAFYCPIHSKWYTQIHLHAKQRKWCERERKRSKNPNSLMKCILGEHKNKNVLSVNVDFIKWIFNKILAHATHSYLIEMWKHMAISRSIQIFIHSTLLSLLSIKWEMNVLCVSVHFKHKIHRKLKMAKWNLFT